MSEDSEFECRRGYRNGVQWIVWSEQMRDFEKWKASYRERHQAKHPRLSASYMAGWIQAADEHRRAVEEREIQRAYEHHRAES